MVAIILRSLARRSICYAEAAIVFDMLQQGYLITQALHWHKHVGCIPRCK